MVVVGGAFHWGRGGSAPATPAVARGWGQTAAGNTVLVVPGGCWVGSVSGASPPKVGFCGAVQVPCRDALGGRPSDAGDLRLLRQKPCPGLSLRLWCPFVPSVSRTPLVLLRGLTLGLPPLPPPQPDGAVRGRPCPRGPSSRGRLPASHRARSRQPEREEQRGPGLRRLHGFIPCPSVAMGWPGQWLRSLVQTLRNPPSQQTKPTVGRWGGWAGGRLCPHAAQPLPGVLARKMRGLSLPWQRGRGRGLPQPPEGFCLAMPLLERRWGPGLCTPCRPGFGVPGEPSTPAIPVGASGSLPSQAHACEQEPLCPQRRPGRRSRPLPGTGAEAPGSGGRGPGGSRRWQLVREQRF